MLQECVELQDNVHKQQRALIRKYEQQLVEARKEVAELKRHLKQVQARTKSNPQRQASTTNDIIDVEEEEQDDQSSSVASKRTTTPPAAKKRKVSAPRQPPPPPPFLDSVRQKSKREELEAQPCSQCEEFYEATDGANGIKPESPRSLCQHASRHRVTSKIPPSPPGYWDIESPKSPQSGER